MKKLILVLVIVFAFGMNANAQDIAMVDNASIVEKYSSEVNEFTPFTPSQRKKAKEIAKSKLKTNSIMFGSAIMYKETKLYWNVMKGVTTYTFTSDKSFENISFEKTIGTNAKDYAKKQNL